MQVHSFLVHGTDVHPIEVQVHFRFQIPGFQILGLAGPEIQEARERIVAAFNSSEIEFMKKKVIVNLAPSDVKKSGTGHDLAIAIGVIAATHPIFEHEPENTRCFAWGTLSLDGRIQPSGRVASLLDLLCRDSNPKIVYLSPFDARDLQELNEWRKAHHLKALHRVDVRVVESLKEVIEPPALSQTLPLREHQEPVPELLPLLPHQERMLDLSIVGRHHCLILGPKGVGKSQMLEWYRWLTPENDAEKSWRRFLYEDSNGRYSLSRLFPLRSVHAQVKPAHLLGSWGPKGFRAGELSLAHGGILIADEFLEWHRDAKECLREPLQNKRTTIARVQGTTQIECDFQLIATGNLCPCGGLPDRFRTRQEKSKARVFPCTCPPVKVDEYLQRLSGPIADRIDLIAVFQQEVELARLNYSSAITVDVIQQKKSDLMQRQQFAIRRFGAIPSELTVRWLEVNLPEKPIFQTVLASRNLSLRARHKVLRLARTIQALEQSEELKIEHMMEAMAYRLPDPASIKYQTPNIHSH